jgi:serine protease Do/serine protease DegQ
MMMSCRRRDRRSRLAALGAASCSLALAFGAGLDHATAAAGIPILSDVPTLAPVVDKVVQGVVNIAVSGSVAVQNPLMSDPFFRQFFRLPDQPLRRQVQAAGSGVIVDAGQGYILTNNHVVAVGE